MASDETKQLRFTPYTQVSTSNIRVPAIIRDPSLLRAGKVTVTDVQAAPCLLGEILLGRSSTMSGEQRQTGKHLRPACYSKCLPIKNYTFKSSTELSLSQKCNLALYCKMTPFPLETIYKSNTREINTAKVSLTPFTSFKDPRLLNHFTNV